MVALVVVMRAFLRLLDQWLTVPLPCHHFFRIALRILQSSRSRSPQGSIDYDRSCVMAFNSAEASCSPHLKTSRCDLCQSQRNVIMERNLVKVVRLHRRIRSLISWFKLEQDLYYINAQSNKSISRFGLESDKIYVQTCYSAMPCLTC